MDKTADERNWRLPSLLYLLCLPIQSFQAMDFKVSFRPRPFHLLLGRHPQEAIAKLRSWSSRFRARSHRPRKCTRRSSHKSGRAMTSLTGILLSYCKYVFVL